MNKIAHRMQVFLDRAAELARSADAPRTVHEYKTDVQDWTVFADAAGVDAFPIIPEAMCAYIGHLVDRKLKVSTIERRCAAIARLHRDKGEESPTEHRYVRNVMKGLRRELGVAPNRKAALTGSIVRVAMLSDAFSMRDKALLSIGFVTGLRRSELVALTWLDVENQLEGLLLNVRRGKTDKTGKGRLVAVPFAEDGSLCAATALLTLKEADREQTGLLFAVSGRHVARVVKRAAKLAGADPKLYGAHSLRAGLATAAAVSGVTLGESMAATGHRSHSVAATYVRPVEALRNRAFRAAVDALKEE